MAGNLYQRYVWLLDTISRWQGITFEDIDRRWQYSALNDTKEPLPKRTFHNHLKAIEELFGIKISCPNKSGYRYYIEESGDINLRDTQSSLLQHLQLSNAMFNNPRLKGRIVMDRFQMWLHFTPLITAMDEGKAVEITCRRADRGINNVQRIILEPYFIKQFKNWFLVGRALSDGLIHSFAFSSIRNIEITEREFNMPSDFDVMEYIIQPAYNEPSADIADDSDLYLLERAEDRIRRRSRDKKMYEPQTGEWDYAELELKQTDVVNCLREEQNYRALHANRVFLEQQEDFRVSIFSDKPRCEPFVNVERLSELVSIKVAICDGRFIGVDSRHSEESQPAIVRLIADTRKWLDSPCRETYFNGSNRDYALWMWNKLEM